jgi:putative redox protein
MANVEITWINEQRYLAVDSSNHSVILSPPNDVGMKPSEMLLVSLATCTAYDVVKILQKQRVTLERMSIQVSSEQASDPPWKYQRIHLQFSIVADNVTAEKVDKAIDLSMNQYCSVRATLATDVEVTFASEVQASKPS